MNQKVSGRAQLRSWAWFALAMIICQAGYWLALSPLLSQRTAIAADAIVSELQAAPLAEATLTGAHALDAGAWATVTPGWSAPSSQPTHAFRFIIPLDAAQGDDLGLIIGIGADNHHVWVNGQPIVDAGRIGPDATFHARALRGVQRVPAAALRAGDNEVMIIATRRSPGFTDVFPSAWGGYEEMRASTARRAFMTGEYPFIVMILFGFTAAFAWVLLPFASNRAFVGWFAILATALALQIAERRFADPPWAPEAVMAIYFALAIITATAWFCLLDAWSGRGSPLLRRAVTVVGAVLIGASAYLVSTQGASGFVLAGSIADYGSLAAGIAAAALFLWRVPAHGRERPWEAAALLVAVAALITDAGFQVFAGRFTGHLTAATPFLILALLAAMLVRNVRIYESMSALNADLNARLALREAEIAAHHQKLSEAQRARDLADERQRILRDMHDGLGGQLMSMLLAARRGRIAPRQVEEGLQSAIDEMRLMIDSMDSDGRSLGTALALFLERAKPRVEAAGFRFSADLQALPTLPNLGGREALHVLRIIQEAITNAMKHSRGSHIRFEIIQAEPEATEIRITDDGAGGARDGAGRGLDHMRTRARAIGAGFTVEAAQPGTRVRLRLAHDASAALRGVA